MERATVNGVELEYEVAGKGEPIVLLHGGLLADENTPLMSEPAFIDNFTVLNYHRRGFAGSTKAGGHAMIPDQVADCIALMDHVGFDTVHVVGHSLGGAIGVQLALDVPDRVHDLVVLEPALMGAIAKAEAAARPEAAASQSDFVQGMIKVKAIADSGDKRGALIAFLETRAGDSFRGVLEFLTKTGEFDQAVEDADTFLGIEMPAAFAWNFTPADAGRITQPVLSVLGSHSPERAQHVHKVLTEWVPHTELLTLPNAEHALPLMDPPGIAEAISEWLLKHPIS